MAHILKEKILTIHYQDFLLIMSTRSNEIAEQMNREGGGGGSHGTRAQFDKLYTVTSTHCKDSEVK